MTPDPELIAETKAWNSVAFRKTHSLEELGEACLQLEPALRPLVDRAEAPSVEEAQEASAIAREVYDAITIRLPAKARP
jgi:hypothetical protein